MKRKVCVVTGTRAEYGLFVPIMRKIQASNNLELQLVATTMHLSEEFGLTYKQIEKDGFTINEKIENLLAVDSKAAMAKSSGLATLLISDTFSRLQPDILLLLGDRFETHAAATTAMLMNIPIAHIHGGEVTEGAVDEQIRHSITKMAYLHFTSTHEYRKRVIQLGEMAENVFVSGAPGIDNIVGATLLSQSELEKALGWQLNKPTALLTFHPETLATISLEYQIEKVLEAIESTGINVLFTYANADDGGRKINKALESFASQDNIKYLVVKSLGQMKYLSAMKYADMLIGNTSSGIIEAASFGKPVVNIGNRQQGRIQGQNIINSNFSDIAEAIAKALTPGFQESCQNIANVYGDGRAAERIVNVLETHKLSVVKKFMDRS